MEVHDPLDGGPPRQLVAVNNDAPGNAHQRKIYTRQSPDPKVNLK